MWQKLLLRFLEKMVTHGTLQVTWPDAHVTVHGAGDPQIAIAFSKDTNFRALAMNPELALGEAYTDGHLMIANDDLHGFVQWAVTNAQKGNYGRFGRVVPWLKKAMRKINQHNGLAVSRSNVALTYDLSTDFYEKWLDEDMTYTCAFYSSDNLSIKDAQIEKKALVTRKLMIEPGMRVLDIGCGWGGLAITMARDYGAQVVGITLSQSQLDYARKRVKDAGLEDQIELRLQDYRHVTEKFDRIAAIGVLEHVGRPQFRTFFDKLHAVLKPDGIALVHTMGRSTVPNVTAPWIGKYIFPGCYVPAMSEVLTEIERSEMIVTDVEVLRMHYAKTLRAWSAGFEENVDEIRAMYDQRFIRMWRYYLAVGEVGFTHLGNVNFHFQLTHDQLAVPTTRNYLLQDT